MEWVVLRVSDVDFAVTVVGAMFAASLVPRLRWLLRSLLEACGCGCSLAGSWDDNPQ